MSRNGRKNPRIDNDTEMEKVYPSFDLCLPPPPPPPVGLLPLGLGGRIPTATVYRHSERNFSTWASKSGGFSTISVLKNCGKCGGKGAIECPGCKGTGKNKKNGNIFERWKCFDCQGFGLKSCPSCGKGGLTPEQRGER